MGKEIVAQVVLNIARDSNQDPAHPELEKGLGQGHDDEQTGEEEQRPPDEPRREAVNSFLQDERQAGAQRLGQRQSAEAHHEAPAVTGKIRKKGTKTFQDCQFR